MLTRTIAIGDRKVVVASFSGDNATAVILHDDGLFDVMCHVRDTCVLHVVSCNTTRRKHIGMNKQDWLIVKRNLRLARKQHPTWRHHETTY